MDGPLHSPGGPEESSRAPKISDLSRLCAELNRRGARYLVVGGFAIIQAGLPRLTGDIELLIDVSLENEALVFDALRTLPDQAVNQLNPGDVEQFGVVRVGDEITVDLMKSGCGVDFADAIRDALYDEVEGVRIPFASPQTLWRMKQTHREKDIPDRLFLRRLLAAQGIIVEEMPLPPREGLGGWLKREFGGGE